MAFASINMILESLPEYLGERTRIVEKQLEQSKSAPRFVLYWMCTAVRSDENPALDVARLLASQRRVPLLIYHSISEDYEFASDRHHMFMLQGARDVQRQFSELGLSYAFHLATRDDRRTHLVELARQSGLVVTEDMPVGPPRRFREALSKRANTPIVCVDTSCNAPMQLVGKAYTRAFEFRSATKQIYAERIGREWPEAKGNPAQYDFSSLPFESIDLQNSNLSELISRCDIDHSIGPVFDSIGGSSAGYERWEDFKNNRIKHYARHRNNALRNGVSRMSPYLHYGMVSPFRIAREASNVGNEGSEKYLDELLIWRELAYSFCFYREDYDRWSAIPSWAQETLQLHASDSRPQLYDWEHLARGETDDPFWNAAQKSLLTQGELHNNVRMTWGKSILNWMQSPQEALAMIIDLNNRYSLDGRDPASYGGILWCLGQFDRPFQPEQKIFGTVRTRSTSFHAKRLDVAKYSKLTTTPRTHKVLRVAVIGAGISGLFAARTMQDHGLNVTVFEKSRGVGGRMATRRANGVTFDHGAQYFTARDPRFARYVRSWTKQGIVSKWPDGDLGKDQRIVVIKGGAIQSESTSQDRFVAVPTLNSICKHLARDVAVQTETRITQLEQVDEQISVSCEDGTHLGKFDRLIVAIPAAQAAELVSGIPTLTNKISAIEMNPCWALMASFAEPVTQDWAGAFLHDSFLSWAARDSTKPGRPSDSEQLILHASPDWTLENWERDPEQVGSLMLDEFWRVTGVAKQTSSFMCAHRWRYAIPLEPATEYFFMDESERIICCGDWASGSRVEGAFLSGMAAAGRVLGTVPYSNQPYKPEQKELF